MLSVNSLFCSSAHFVVFPLWPQVLSWPLVTLLIIASSSSMLLWAIGIKKTFLQWVTFPGNLDSSSLTPEGLVVPLVCSFRRQDNLLAWHELFANLYELKSRIWFWKEYNYLEQIYRVYRCRCSTHHVLNFLNKNVSPPAVCPDRRYTHHSGRSGLWRYWNKNRHITSQIDTRAKLQMARKENKFHQNIPRIMKNVQVWQKILDIWSICPMLSIYVTHLAYFQLLRL